MTELLFLSNLKKYAILSLVRLSWLKGDLDPKMQTGRVLCSLLWSKQGGEYAKTISLALVIGRHICNWEKQRMKALWAHQWPFRGDEVRDDSRAEGCEERRKSEWTICWGGRETQSRWEIPLLYCAGMGRSCDPLTCNWINKSMENCAGGPAVKNPVCIVLKEYSGHYWSQTVICS